MKARIVGVLLLLVFAGCKNPGKSGLANGPSLPLISGDWTGSMQMTEVGSTPSMAMTLQQQNINVRGNYSAPALSAAQIGDQGTVTGLTTGQTFRLTLTSTVPGCVASININGMNSGDELAFDFSGVNCSCTTVSGQGYCQRPH